MRDYILLHLPRSIQLFKMNFLELFPVNICSRRLFARTATTTCVTCVKQGSVFTNRSSCHDTVSKCEKTPPNNKSAVMANLFSTRTKTIYKHYRGQTSHSFRHKRFMLLGFSLVGCGLHANLFNNHIHVLWQFSRSKHRNAKTGDTGSGNPEDSEESSDDETTEDVNTYEDLAGAPNNFTVIKVHSKALRSDAIASLGLNIARNKIDELFYNSKLRLNGDKLLKKSQKMEVGDYVEVITEKREEQLTVKRVQIIKVGSERTRSDKLYVWLRVWKQGFQIDHQDNSL